MFPLYTLRWMIFPQRSFPWGGEVYFIEGKRNLPVLFEKGIEIILYMKGCPFLNTLLFTLKFDTMSPFFKSVCWKTGPLN